MRIDLDARVVSSDGKELGSVQRAVFDPQRQEVTQLVISTGGLLGRDVLVPIEQVAGARPDGDAIQLTLDRASVERLETFVPEQYGMPPAGWIYPGAYGFGAYGGFVWPMPYVPPPQPAPGVSPHDQEATIAKGATVMARGGEDVGVVDDIRVEGRRGELQGFVLRIGGALRTFFGGGDTVVVDRQAIDRVEDGIVYLHLSADEIRDAVS
jgi:sporulation protein YlmC with PRC-barrel domain